jgi:glucosamine--fructose-6-phosphate aminotransferase (isomerizing)
MCGIVGYIGSRQVKEILLEGLKRLEYRGYDSAGISVLTQEGLATFKRPGKIAELENDFNQLNLSSTVGIAHTRWATHGYPSEENAHPHSDCTGEIALVHNGIIENFSVLKERLIELGHKFKTETDTEVLAHLIEENFEGNLEIAVQKALRSVEGAYGIAVISTRDPDKIVAARLGSPLVIGLANGDLILASDCSAIAIHTKQVIYLDDGEMAVLTRNGYSTTDLENTAVTKEIEEISWDVKEIEKGGFDHFMLKEIFEQPEALENTMRGRLVLEDGNVMLGGLNLTKNELRDVNRIIITACGTSWHAALIGEYMLEEIARIPVEVEYASEFRYRNPIVDERTLVVVISQSGETADTLAAMREAQAKGARIIGICNVVGSTIAREANAGIYIHAGPEIGVASTKAFTCQIVSLLILTLLFGRLRSLPVEEGQKIIRALQEIPSRVKKILEMKNDEIRDLAHQYYKSSNFLYLGRGYHFPVALEGALKLKEISYIHAEGYPAAEMKHGPIALIDENMPVVVIATKDSVYSKVLSNIEEVKVRRGRIIAVANEDDNKIGKLVDHVITVPKTIDILAPILTIAPLQLLAYHIAVFRECDVDKPRNLAKSVTVE